MKTVTYTYVLQKAVELTGRIYPPSTEDAAVFRTFIGSALRQAWEAFDWPDVTQITQEFFAPTYSNSTSYSFGNYVYYPVEQKYYQYVSSESGSNNPPTIGGPGGTLNFNKWAAVYPTGGGSQYSSTATYSGGDIVLWPTDQNHYQCIVSSSTGADPNTSNWGRLVTFYQQVSKTTNANGTARTTDLGEILSVWPQDPRLVWQQSQPTYSLNSEGIIVGTILPCVWVESRQSPPIYTSDPATIPYRFAEICAYRAAGQMLRVDGKIDLGNEFLLMGESALTDEVDKVARQEMYVRGVTVKTR